MLIHHFIATFFLLHIEKSVNTEKNVVDEDFSSSQCDFVIQVTEAGQSVVSLSSPGNQLEKAERSAEEVDRAASPEQVWIDTVYVASSVMDTWQGGSDLPMPTEEATTIDVSGAEKNVDEVASSIPVRAEVGFEPNGFTFREAVFHVLVNTHTGLSKPLVFPSFRICESSSSDSASLA